MEVTEEFVTQFKEAPQSTGLVTNESKTKYVKIKQKYKTFTESLVIGGKVFEGVQNIRYVGTLRN